MVLLVLRSLTVRGLAREANMSERQVRRLLRGECYPQRAHRNAFTSIAGERARAALIATGCPVPRDGLACCAAWLITRVERVQAAGPGGTVRGKPPDAKLRRGRRG